MPLVEEDHLRATAVVSSKVLLGADLENRQAPCHLRSRPPIGVLQKTSSSSFLLLVAAHLRVFVNKILSMKMSGEGGSLPLHHSASLTGDQASRHLRGAVGVEEGVEEVTAIARDDLVDPTAKDCHRINILL